MAAGQPNTAPIEKFVPAVRNARALRTNFPLIAPSTQIGGINGTVVGTLASAPTITFTPANVITQHTPTQNETINFTPNTSTNARIIMEIITSGTTSYTITFGTGVRSQGTLATGTTSGKIFTLTFQSDGTQYVELCRTSAM